MAMGEDLPMLRIFSRKRANGVPAAAIATQLMIVTLLLLPKLRKPCWIHSIQPDILLLRRC